MLSLRARRGGSDVRLHRAADGLGRVQTHARTACSRPANRRAAVPAQRPHFMGHVDGRCSGKKHTVLFERRQTGEERTDTSLRDVCGQGIRGCDHVGIFHFHADVISRGDGHSAVAAAAYRAGERIVEMRTGEVHDYSRRFGVDHREIIAPRGAPGWCKNRTRLWNRAEKAERRCDSQIAREIELALPRELSFKQRRRLVRRYVRKHFTSRGMVADVAYHDQDGDNPHVHILLTMRRLAGAGFNAKKERAWNKRECVGEWRSGWARRVNAFLCRAGCRNRVDHRSLAAQRADALAAGNDELAAKLDRAPGRHYGRAATAIQARADRVEFADWVHGEALRIGEADQPDYRYVAEPHVPSSRVADIREAMELENTERSIRREGEQLARERIALEKRIADAARAAGLNDVEIDNIHSAAEAQEAGSGLEAVHLATKAHVEHWREARESARAVCVDVDSVSAGTRGGNTDLLKALESATERRQTEIKAEARAAGLDDETIRKLYDEAEAQRTGSGWTAVVSATAAQVDRRKKAERVARKFDVDIGNVVAAAGTRNDDPAKALESVILDRWTKISKEALAAGLDKETITRIWRAAEQQESDSGWRRVQEEAAARVERRRKATNSARAVDVDVEVMTKARAAPADPLTALESVERDAAPSNDQDAAEALLAATEGCREAHREEGRKAGLDDDEMDRIRRTAEPDDLDRREEALRAMSTGAQHFSAVVSELFEKQEQARTLTDRESMIGEAVRRVEEELRGREAELRRIPLGTQYLAEAERALLGGAERSRTLAERESIVMTAEQRLGEELNGREVRFVESVGGHELLAEAFFEVCADDTIEDAPSLSERSQIITLAEQWHEEDRAADAEWSANLDRAEGKLRATSIGADHLNAAQRTVVDAGQDPSSLETREAVVNTARRRVEDELDEREAAVRGTTRGSAWLIKAKQRVLSEHGREPTLDERERAIETVEEQIRADIDRRRESIVATDDGYRLWSKVSQQREDNAIPQTLAEEEQQVEQVEDQLREHRAAERRAARMQEEEERQRQELASRVAAIRATSSGSRRLEAERRARFGTTTRSLRVDEETSIVEAVDLQITEDLDRRKAKIAAHAGGEALLRAVRERRSQTVPFVDLAEREHTVVAVEQSLRAADELEALLPTTVPDPERRPEYRVPAVSDAALKEAVNDDDPRFVQDTVFVLRERYAQRGGKPAAEGGYDALAREESQRRHLGDRLAGALRRWALRIRELILTACDLILGGHGDVGERVQTLARETAEELGVGDPGGGGADPARAATRRAMLEHHGVMKPNAGEGTGAERPAPQTGQPKQDLGRNRSRQGR